MKSAITALACLLALMFGMTALAQDDAIDIDAAAAAATIDDVDREGERCINTSRIRNTHIVDDKTILFYMSGGDVYRNTLRFGCPGLERADRFSYKVTAGRLCSVDSIRVLDNFGGGLAPGMSCGLTEFYAISEGEADFLRYGERNELQEEPEAVDVPDDEED
jgi:hypothetical protein